MTKFAGLISVLACVIMLFTSCETLKDLQNTNGNNSDEINEKELPKWTISINELIKYPRATPLETEVPTFSGPSVWVKKHYEFNSRSIKKIDKIPIQNKPGYYDLKIVLDRQGSLVAMRLCNDVTHEPLAILIDGVCYRSIDNISAANNDYSEIVIKGPFDEPLSNFLVKYAPANYKHFHPDDDKRK